MKQLEGLTALVTGGGRGLGRAIAVGFAREGANVVVVSRQPPEDIVREIEAQGVRGAAIAYDLSNCAGIPSLVDRVAALFGGIDILCNDAGTQRRHPSAEFPKEDWDYVMNVNCHSVFYMCQAVGRLMLPKGRGKIINIASLLSFQGGITVPAYAASKGAVMQFSKTLSNEWASKGINVNCIAPGYMDTEMNTALKQDATRSRQILERIPAGKWGRPEDIAGAAVFLASAASDYVNGIVLPVDGGWLGR